LKERKREVHLILLEIKFKEEFIDLSIVRRRRRRRRRKRERKKEKRQKQGFTEIVHPVMTPLLGQKHQILTFCVHILFSDVLI